MLIQIVGSYDSTILIVILTTMVVPIILILAHIDMFIQLLSSETKREFQKKNIWWIKSTWLAMKSLETYYRLHLEGLFQVEKEGYKNYFTLLRKKITYTE